MSIEKTYEIIKNCIQSNIDSLNVVKQVEEYRQFWKPELTNVILLAESHVYTDERDFEVKCNKHVLNSFIPNYPIHYVRFVYCLGYGENDILNQHLGDNRGTPQYWKIFCSCVAENDKDLGFQKILKTETSLTQRLRNKVNILQEMQKKGIWLLDASIVGIYRAIGDYETKEKIIKTCWDEHIRNVIIDCHPKHIIVIGKGKKSVEDILHWRLEQLRVSMGISSSALPQPQGIRRSSEEQLDNFRKYQRICSRYCQTPNLS